MPTWFDRARWHMARAIAPRPRRPEGAMAGRMPPGGFSFGATHWYGGPRYTDPFASRRAPGPWELIDRYKTLIYALVQRNANGVARVPLRLYMDGSRGQGGPPRRWCDPIKVSRSTGARLARAGLVSPAAVDRVYEVRNHPFLDVLDNPDGRGYYSRKKLIALLVTMMDVIGSGFLVPDGAGWDWNTGVHGPGPPEYLWVMYPQYVIPVREPGSPLVREWWYFRERMPFESTLWFRQVVSLRDPYGAGYSPTYAGDMYQDQEQRMVAIADQMLGLGPRPNLVASPRDPMFPPGEDERRRHEQDLNRRHSAGDAGRAIVTDGAYEYTPINQPAADRSWRDLSEYDRDCLAALFGVPPTYFTTDTNLANLQAADEQHARAAVEPRCDAISEPLTLLARSWDPRLSFKFEAAIQEDDESREKVIAMRLAEGRTTINQENEEERFPPVWWGDEPWLPGTVKQPSMIKDAHDRGMEMAAAGAEGLRDAPGPARPPGGDGRPAA